MKAGFGQSDITPRLGVQLSGYGPYRNRAAQEIVAPLYSRAMLLEKGKRRSVVISLEIGGTTRLLAEKIRQAVASRVGCRADDVLVSSTHTHSAPAVFGLSGWGESDMMYFETLPARAAEAAARAVDKLAEVEWRHAEAPCEGIAVNRETDTGFALNENFQERMSPDWRPAKPQHTDPNVRLLAAYAEGKLVGLLHHFGCHPVVYGEKTAAIHGDYPGMACLELEKKYAGAVAMFFPGAIGDINPKLNHRVPSESRKALKAISRQYYRAILTGLKAAQKIDVPTFKMVRQDSEFSRKKWSRRGVERRIADLEKIFTNPQMTDDPFAGGSPPLLHNGMEMARLEGLRRVLSEFRGDKAPNPSVCLHGLRLGPVVILGGGLEAYHALQAPVVKASPHDHTWLVSLVGGHGYAPDKAAHLRQGYSGDFVPLICGELPYAKVYAELPRALVKLAKALS